MTKKECLKKARTLLEEYYLHLESECLSNNITDDTEETYLNNMNDIQNIIAHFSTEIRKM